MWKKALLFSLVVIVIRGGPALSQQPQGQQAGNTPNVTLPKPYDSIIAAAGSLVASATTTSKAARADARTLAIKAALTRKLSSAFDPKNTLYLDEANADTSLGEEALLCDVRLKYISRSISLNYLGSLVRKLSDVSKPATPPKDIISA
jgi:hypothetical protein